YTDNLNATDIIGIAFVDNYRQLVTATNIYGIRYGNSGGTAINIDGGSATNIYGIRLGGVNTENGGAITNNYGLDVDRPCTGLICNGTISNNYGLYIEDMSAATTGATNTYGIYSAGGNNYFGGPVGIGTTAPTGNLDVRGDEVRIWTGAGTDTNATSAGEL